MHWPSIESTKQHEDEWRDLAHAKMIQEMNAPADVPFFELLNSVTKDENTQEQIYWWETLTGNLHHWICDHIDESCDFQVDRIPSGERPQWAAFVDGIEEYSNELILKWRSGT